MLPPVDPEVAARTFHRHLDTYWANRDLSLKGWSRVDVGELHTVVSIPARRADGTTEPYFIRLGAEYYDPYPPTVLIVTPTDGWPRARSGTTWWPQLSAPGWFGLHDSYQYRNGQGQVLLEGQLVCFSMTAEYYMSNHSPTEEQKWQQGRHTVAATLSRLAEVLGPPHYIAPGAPRPA
jgi:hypothetical protein